jgi:hypothetical protein
MHQDPFARRQREQNLRGGFERDAPAVVGVLSPGGIVDGLAALPDHNALRQGVALENETARPGTTAEWLAQTVQAQFLAMAQVVQFQDAAMAEADDLDSAALVR